MRIAMLAPRPNVRGPLPKHTPILVEALRGLGCEVDVLRWGRRSDDERLPGKLLGRGRDVMSVRKTVSRGGFDVVVVKTGHDWMTITRDLALLLAMPRAPIVLQFHGSQSTRLRQPGSHAFKRATRALVDRADGILVLSREEQADWKVFRPGLHVSVVRNPRPELPDAAALPRRPASGRKTILCVSRLIPSKGVVELVRALPLVRAAVPSRLVIAGEGPDRERLHQLADELGVSDSLELAGYVEGSDLAGLYRSADVFALPTTHIEGFPTVFLEAMAAGLPIVTTSLRGAADHLVEERNVLFVPPGDVQSLGATLTRVLADSELGRRIGEANREKVREFDPQRVADEYLAALRAIVLARAWNNGA